MKKALVLTTALALSAGVSAAKADEVFVGHLVDFTGATAFVGSFYGPAIADAVAYINANGGIDGTTINMDTVDYAYKVDQALSYYRDWQARGMVALQGWGTADTEALVDIVKNDQVPTWSASYSGHLTDPSNSPYNFFYGPSYTDGCRALVQWAANDAKERGIENPKFLHTGDNHPYPNAPKEACAEWAAELGFEVLEPIVVPLAPGDFTPQCLSIRESGAEYTWIGNLGGSVVALLKSCSSAGVETQFMANVWGGDEETIKAAEASELMFPSANPPYGTDVPGMATITAILEQAGKPTDANPTHHYLRGVCTAYYMKEAMEWAKAENGEITGPGIRQGMYAHSAAHAAEGGWVPAGLEGVCQPSIWTDSDHRGTMQVVINRGSFVFGAAELEQLDTVVLERDPRWLGR